jgi:hypothetical protein
MIYERIEKSLTDAIKLHNEGESANQSIVKVARQNELNPETISRVVEAFNIAKTKAYVKLASDKSGDFELADKQTVIKSVFNNSNGSEKVSNQENFSEFDGFSEYTEFDKNANEVISVCNTSEVSLDSKVKAAFNSIEDDNRKLAHIRDSVIEQKEKFISSFNQACSLLEYTEEKENIAKYASEIFFEYSDNPMAGKILSLIAKVANIDFDDLSEKIGSITDYSDSKFLDLFDSMVESENIYSSKTKEFNSALHSSVEKQAELRKMLYKISGVETQKDASTLMWRPGKGNIVSNGKFSEFPENLVSEISSDLFNSSVKTAESGGTSASGLINKFLVVPQPNPTYKSYLDKADEGFLAKAKGQDSPLSDQKFKAELADLKRHALLSELMKDEIISQQSPKDIENAYNTLAQLAPRVSLMPDITRSILRQGTGQVMDPHFAQVLVSLESNLAGNKSQVKKP